MKHMKEKVQVKLRDKRQQLHKLRVITVSVDEDRSTHSLLTLQRGQAHVSEEQLSNKEPQFSLSEAHFEKRDSETKSEMWIYGNIYEKDEAPR